MIKTKETKDYTTTVVLVYNLIRDKFKYSARIVDIWELLKAAFMIPEFEILDTKTVLNGPLESFLIDEQVKWVNGEEVNFKDIYDALLKGGEFTTAEKRLFIDGNIEERLWAIMLAVTDPGLNIEVKLN